MLQHFSVFLFLYVSSSTAHFVQKSSTIYKTVKESAPIGSLLKAIKIAITYEIADGIQRWMNLTLTHLPPFEQAKYSSIDI